VIAKDDQGLIEIRTVFDASHFYHLCLAGLNSTGVRELFDLSKQRQADGLGAHFIPRNF
jgi:hypothetical protein